MRVSPRARKLFERTPWMNSSVITVLLYFYGVVSIKTITAISSIVIILITYFLLRKVVGSPWRSIGLPSGPARCTGFQVEGLAVP